MLKELYLRNLGGRGVQNGNDEALNPTGIQAIEFRVHGNENLDLSLFKGYKSNTGPHQTTD